MILASILISSILMPTFWAEAYGAKPSITEIRCKNHLINYIKLGEIDYKERYKNNRVVDSCIKLFKDSKSELYFEPSKITNIENKDTLFKITYNKSIGEKYRLLKYQVCNNEEISKNKILFETYFESSLIILPKHLSPNQCTDFWIEVLSKNIGSIKTEWYSGDEKSLKIKKIFR